MPLGWHYCCLWRGTTVAPLVLLLMLEGVLGGRRIAFEARAEALFPEFIPGGWNKGVGEGEIRRETVPLLPKENKHEYNAINERLYTWYLARTTLLDGLSLGYDQPCPVTSFP